MNKRNNSPRVIHFSQWCIYAFWHETTKLDVCNICLLFSIFTFGLGPLHSALSDCRAVVLDLVSPNIVWLPSWKSNKKETYRQKYPIFVFYFPLLICPGLFNIHRPDATEDFCKLLLVAVAIGHFHFIHCFNLSVIKVVKSWDCYKIQHAAILQLHFIWTFDQPWFFFGMSFDFWLCLALLTNKIDNADR